MQRFSSVIPALIGFTCLALTALPTLAQQTTTVIEGVTVVSAHLEAPLPGMSVVIEGELIVSIASADQLKSRRRKQVHIAIGVGCIAAPDTWALCCKGGTA